MQLNQESVKGLPCQSDKRGHLLNAHRMCQWCHMEEKDLMIQLLQKRCTALERMLKTMVEHLDWAMKYQLLYPDEIAEDRNEVIKLLPASAEKGQP